MNRTLALLIAIALAATTASAQTMYKWKDEKGVTHFSEDPPPDGKAQQIQVKPTPPSSTPPAEPKPNEINRRALDLQDQRVNKANQEAKEKRAAEQSRAQCLSAQRNLDVLRRERPVYTVNERGERVYVDDKERAARVDSAERSVRKYCAS